MAKFALKFIAFEINEKAKYKNMLILKNKGSMFVPIDVYNNNILTNLDKLNNWKTVLLFKIFVDTNTD